MAADVQTDEQIAKEVGCSRSTLARWKIHPEFSQHVAELTEEFNKRLLKFEITNKSARLARLQKRWDGIDQLITARSVAAREGMEESETLVPGKEHIPGEETGLLAIDLKSLREGEESSTVRIGRFDAALIKEERELAKQAAIEQGEWNEKDGVLDGAKRLVVEFE